MSQKRNHKRNKKSLRQMKTKAQKTTYRMKLKKPWREIYSY